MNRTFYLETMGCQMNKLDSELVVNNLSQMGYQRLSDPAEAGVIIFNTCSVRQHAEDIVISKIGQLRKLHRQRPDLILAVIGCMAQRVGQGLLEKYEQVDIVCGPGQLHKLASMIEQVSENRRCNRLVALNDQDKEDDLEKLDNVRRLEKGDKSFQAYLRVMRGCNKYCSYCIVPYVRGPEQSRPLKNIVNEARLLVRDGVKEITLLGQTVNSYRYKTSGKVLGLADVLEALHEIEGLRRIRFVTSYPRKFDERILVAMAELDKVCPYLHIPAQSGSDRILKAMNRHYTAGEYLELIERTRRVVPDFSVAGDFIVGFPGETEDDFQATKELMKKVRYKNCFIFKYSPRPGTRADQKIPDDVPMHVKQSRNMQLLELQNEISFEDNQRFVGQTVEVLVEGLSKNPHLDKGRDGSKEAAESQLIGRTSGDHIVVFNGPVELIGTIVPVKVTKTSALTLFAVVG